jgi:branched-chain amino acid transport system substrate-binding protein
VTVGYGRSESSDGAVFKWNFPIAGTYWVAADTILQAIAKKEGGWDKLERQKDCLGLPRQPVWQRAYSLDARAQP